MQDSVYTAALLTKKLHYSVIHYNFVLFLLVFLIVLCFCQFSLMFPLKRQFLQVKDIKYPEIMQ